jgi:hypothetical protein
MELMAPRDGLDQTAWLALVIDVPRIHRTHPVTIGLMVTENAGRWERKLKI